MEAENFQGNALENSFIDGVLANDVTWSKQRIKRFEINELLHGSIRSNACHQALNYIIIFYHINGAFGVLFWSKIRLTELFVVVREFF